MYSCTKRNMKRLRQVDWLLLLAIAMNVGLGVNELSHGHYFGIVGLAVAALLLTVVYWGYKQRKSATIVNERGYPEENDD